MLQSFQCERLVAHEDVVFGQQLRHKGLWIKRKVEGIDTVVASDDMGLQSVSNLHEN